MRERLRAIVEQFLPWYDARDAARRDARTEHIRRRSISARIRAEDERHLVATTIRGTVDGVRSR